MSRRLLVGLFVAALLVQPALAAQPASAASYPDAETVCGLDGDGERLVGYLPGASGEGDAETLTGNESVYAGTTFRLALCKGGDLAPTRGSEWTLDASAAPGLEALDSTDSYVTVRVTDAAEGTIDVLELVGEKETIDAPVLTVQSAPTVDSELADATIRFESDDSKRAYETAEDEYLAALDDLENATDRLNESARALDSGATESLDASDNGTDENVSAVLDGRDALASASDDLENRTFEAAFRGSGGTNALDALSAAQDDEQEARADARAAMENYHGALEAAASDARSTALLNLGVALLVGLLVGAVPGWKLTASQLEDIRRDREVNSRVDYSPRVLARALGLAAVALVLAVGALVAVGDPAALGGLL